MNLARLALSFTVLSVLAAPALAHPTGEPAPTQRDAFELLLESIDVVPPSRELFEGAFPGARDRLDAAARDVSRTTWVRVRAISMLSYFPDASTAATLRFLAVPPAKSINQNELLRHPAHDPDIRRHALYTLGRAFGAIADAELVRFIAQRIDKDPSNEVKEHALRSLRWVDHDEAKVVLNRLTTAGPATLKPLATSTLNRRQTRIDAPRYGH